MHEHEVFALGFDVQQLVERLERAEYGLLLLAKHVGGYGWNRELREVIDAIRDDTREIIPK